MQMLTTDSTLVDCDYSLNFAMCKNSSAIAIVSQDMISGSL